MDTVKWMCIHVCIDKGDAWKSKVRIFVVLAADVVLSVI